MTHGYYYICDHCEKSISMAKERCLRYSVTYTQPKKWLELNMDGTEYNFCSNKCAKAFTSELS